jgi:hypothetical protein
MANEITVQTSLQLANGNLKFARGANFKADQATGIRGGPGVQVIGTTQEAIAIGSDVATLGWAWIQNLDATNYVEIGVVVSATFYPTNRFNPGEGYPIRLSPGVTYYAKAHTAPVNLEFEALSN